MTENAPSADLRLGSTEGPVDAPREPEADAKIGPIAPRRRTVPAPEPHLSQLDASIAGAIENAVRAEREQIRREAEDAVERRLEDLQKTMEAQQQESMTRMWHLLTRRMERRIEQRTDGAAGTSRGSPAPKRPNESAGRDSARTKGH